MDIIFFPALLVFLTRSIGGLDTKGIDDFTRDVYQDIKTVEDSNFVVSPLAIRLAVSLFLLIARGQTAKEIVDVLHLKYDIEELKNNVLQIKNNMSGNPTKVGIVSAFVASEGMTVSQLLISSAAQFFGVEVYSLNLRKHIEAVETINKWVKLKTARNIPTIMDPHDLLPSSSIVLLNAIYFKKNFMHKCDGPRIKTFYGFNNAQLKIPFIRVQGDTFYESFHQLNSSAIMLKYEGGHFNLLIILPYDVDGLTQLENSIKGFDIGHITLYKYVLAKVWLPKFKLCTETDFKGSLEELGVKKLFHRANLSGILSPDTIRVDGIRQTALFDVSDETAGTSNIPKARRYSPHKSKPKKVKFKVNHPFIFAVRDSISNIVILIGRFTGTVAETLELKKGSNSTN